MIGGIGARGELLTGGAHRSATVGANMDSVFNATGKRDPHAGTEKRHA